MRLLPLLALLLVSGSTSAAEMRYQVEVEEVATMDDGSEVSADTLSVTATIRLLMVDSAGGRAATFTIESAKFRHTTGPGSSALFEDDPVATGTVLRFHAVPGRRLAALSSTLGQQPTAIPMTPGGNPSGRTIGYVGAALSEFFPRIRTGAATGDHWSDTTSQAGATTVSRWTIGKGTAGLFDVESHDSSATSAAVEGGQITSTALTSRVLHTSVLGPLVRATIRLERIATMTDPEEEPHRLVVRSVRTTRIVRGE
jgi:hypothetical protein